MKTLKNTLALGILVLATPVLFATNTWPNLNNEIEDPLQEVLEMEAIPTIQFKPLNAVQKLHIRLKAAKDNQFDLNLNLNNEDKIGLVILDKNGKTVYNVFDSYQNVKSVYLKDTGDNQYTVKVYNNKTQYQAQILVSHGY